MKVDFPEPFSPSSAWTSPCWDGQIDAFEGAHPAEGLGETFSVECRHVAVVGHPTSQSFLNWSAKSVGLS